MSDNESFKGRIRFATATLQPVLVALSSFEGTHEMHIEMFQFFAAFWNFRSKGIIILAQKVGKGELVISFLDYK